ncbi:MAG: S9 family peptidase [Acidobacteria bacterium]|nr:S9 family peptidase [Acidobacteriota bacterium]
MRCKYLAVLVAFLVLSFSAAAQNYTIQQYLNIKSAGSPTLSPDGKQMAYLTNTTGTSQVWLIDLPNGTPKQLTNYEDNIGFVRWLPDGSGIIFGKARGGDENTQFYWMKTDGSAVRALTDDPKVRNNFAEVSKDGKKIYYASNKRNRTFFDVYSMEIATGKEELLYQYDGNINIAAVNDVGTEFVVSRDSAEKSLDNDLYLVNVRTKTETHLTPHKDASEFRDVSILADSIIFATNDMREFSRLIQLRQRNAAGDDWTEKNREIDVLADDQTTEVDDVTVSDYERYLAYTVNRNGYAELHVRGIETDGKPLISVVKRQGESVKLAGRGVVSGLSFSVDGSRLAFSFSSATKNGDIWLYDLESKRLSQITHSDRAGIPVESFVEPALIKFKSFDGREIPAWYYKPLNTPAYSNYDADSGLSDAKTSSKSTKEKASYTVSSKTEKSPRFAKSDFIGRPTSIFRTDNETSHRVIVSVHGGPEGQERPGFSGLYQYYLSRGYAILATNVRGSTGYGKTFTHLDDVEKREDSVKDLAAAVEWLKTKGGADPKRIAVMGGSYGGYMTMAAITLYPDLWAAAVGTVAITNWETFLQNTSGYRRRQREVEYGRLDRDIEFLRRISPIRKIDRIKTPLFVISGRNDPRVPFTEGEQMVDALKKRGAPVEYKLYDDEGHGISKLKNRLDLYPRVADFLDRYMK